jgi:hypothetical protein
MWVRGTGAVVAGLLVASGLAVGSGTTPAPSRYDCGKPAVAAPGPIPDRAWTAVVTCRYRARVVGTTVVESAFFTVERRGDLGPLLAALRQPDAPPAAVCTKESVILFPIWLVDRDGWAYVPRIPTGPCGRTATAVTAALDALGPA